MGSYSTGYNPPALVDGTTCTVASGTTYEVVTDTDCSVSIFTLNDRTCSDPSAALWPTVQLSGFKWSGGVMMGALPDYNGQDGIT